MLLREGKKRKEEKKREILASDMVDGQDWKKNILSYDSYTFVTLDKLKILCVDRILLKSLRC